MDEYKKILIPTDGSDENEAAVQKGLSLARMLGAKVKLLFVVDTSTFKDVPPDEAITNLTSYMKTKGDEVLKDIEEEAKDKGLRVEKSIIKGHPAETIIEESEDHDLIVIGTHGRGGLSKLLLGSTTEKVVRHSQCPVFVIHIEEE